MPFLTVFLIMCRYLLCFVVLLGVAIPGAVIAQSGTEPVVTEIGTIDTEETDVVIVRDEEANQGTSTPVIAPAASSLPVDNYRREELPTGEIYNDFVIGPGRFEIELAPGESRTVELLVSNRMGEGRIFSFNVEDMVASERSDGSVSLLGEEGGPYTIRDFISIPYEEFYLEHGTRARIPVTIALPRDAEPGGRYGSLLTSIVSDPNERPDTTGAQAGTAIISRIGTLFFVTTPGDIVRESRLLDFSTLNQQKFFGSGPVTFLIESENSGSVHVTPSGVLTVTNILGEEVGSVEIPRWFILPQATRTREVEWNRELLVGRYTATVQVSRGYDDIVDVQSFSFWVIPWKLLLVMFGGLFIFFLIIRAFFSRFEFKRKK